MSTDDPRFRTTVATWKLLALGGFQSVVAFAIWGGLLFWSAGDWHWKRGWLHLALWGLTFAVNLAVLLLKNRAVLEARLKRGKFTERFDIIIMVLFLPVMLAIPAAAGFRMRMVTFSPYEVGMVDTLRSKVFPPYFT